MLLNGFLNSRQAFFSPLHALVLAAVLLSLLGGIFKYEMSARVVILSRMHFFQLLPLREEDEQVFVWFCVLWKSINR